METTSPTKENAQGTPRHQTERLIGTAIQYRWIDTGAPQPDGRIFHDEVQLTINGRTFTVRTGDCVLLFSDEADWDAQWPCRVENMWQPVNSQPSAVMFTARWFCNATEIENLPHHWEGSVAQDDLARQMTSQHVVLSNQTDENEIATIEGPCHMRYCHARDFDGLRLPPKHFVCHYKLDIRDTSVHLLPLEADEFRHNRTLTEEQLKAMGVAAPRALLNDTTRNYQSVLQQEQKEEEEASESNAEELREPGAGSERARRSRSTSVPSQEPPPPPRRPQVAEPTSSDSEESDDESQSTDFESEGDRKHQIAEGEGSIMRSDIQIGSKYQAIVPPFVPGRVVQSRHPKLIYKPDMIAEDELGVFLTRLAEVHTPYLLENGLTMEEPYTPLRSDEAEELMRQTGNKLLTGSTLSTASVLCTKRNGLLKECDTDAVLELLADHKYNTQAALDTVKKDLHRISNGWTRAEKELYEQGIHMHDFSLKDIARMIATKTHQEVVDYHFRFKIADQFRRYKNLKTDQTVRLEESSHKKRYHESTFNPHLVEASNGTGAGANDMEDQQSRGALQPLKRRKHWSETSMADTIKSVENREKGAKDLLMDIQKSVGKEIMQDISAVVRELHRAYDAETKDALFDLLEGHPELQKRLLAWLPNRG